MPASIRLASVLIEIVEPASATVIKSMPRNKKKADAYSAIGL
jgi:hypothetical protein